MNHAEFRMPCGIAFKIDYRDIPLVIPYNWHAEMRGGVIYARGRLPGERGSGIYLHLLINSSRPVTDHRNGDGLDNRRRNLRPCFQAQNAMNVGKKRAHKRFKGVFFDNRRSQWWSQLAVNRKRFFGGYYKTEEDAARSYDRLAIKHHGEFARLNLPAELHRFSLEAAE